MILGLDISTSVVGVCVLNEKNQLKLLEYINLEKEKSVFDKGKKFKEELSLMTSKLNVTRVGIEENLQAFRPGLSSAKTIVTLARFNGICSYISQEIFKLTPEFINVNSARKSLDIKINRKSDKNTKEQVQEHVSSLEPSFDWPTKVMTRGPRKGIVVLIKECYDMADAYVIARSLATRD